MIHAGMPLLYFSSYKTLGDRCTKHPSVTSCLGVDTANVVPHYN